MLKRFMVVAAVSGLALTSAIAQQTNTPPTSNTPSGTSSTPGASSTPSATSNTPSTSATSSTPASGSANFVTKQSPDQHLASKFKGTDVIGSNDEKIGDVSDLLFDKENKIVAYIVGVGGFLGIGQKDVAIAPSSFQPAPGKDPSDVKLRLSMTKDQLKEAPAFEAYQPPRPVSSQNTSGSGSSRPTGAPSTNKQ
jgi:PRC-barrel domain